MLSRKDLRSLSKGKPVFHGRDRKKRRGRFRKEEGRELTGLRWCEMRDQKPNKSTCLWASLISRNSFVNFFYHKTYSYPLLSSLSAKPTLHSKPLLRLFVWQIVSTLTTENSSASGIYYCVASNKIGEEERSIEFYVSGKRHKRHYTKTRCWWCDLP